MPNLEACRPFTKLGCFYICFTLFLYLSWGRTSDLEDLEEKKRVDCWNKVVKVDDIKLGEKPLKMEQVRDKVIAQLSGFPTVRTLCLESNT